MRALPLPSAWCSALLAFCFSFSFCFLVVVLVVPLLWLLLFRVPGLLIVLLHKFALLAGLRGLICLPLPRERLAELPLPGGQLVELSHGWLLPLFLGGLR